MYINKNKKRNLNSNEITEIPKEIENATSLQLL